MSRADEPGVLVALLGRVRSVEPAPAREVSQVLHDALVLEIHSAQDRAESMR